MSAEKRVSNDVSWERLSPTVRSLLMLFGQSSKDADVVNYRIAVIIVITILVIAAE